MAIFAALNWIDWLVAIVILVSTLLSIKRGFFREALSLLIWFLAVVISFTFYQKMAVLLQPYIDSQLLRNIGAIIILFMICLLMGGLLVFLMGQFITFTGLNAFDRFLGMFFGFLRGLILVMLVLLLLRNVLPVEREGWWQHSIFIPHVMRLESSIMLMVTHLHDLIRPLFNNLF